MKHTINRKAILALDEDLSAKRQFGGIASDESVGLDGKIVRTAGLDIENYINNNPVIQHSHNPDWAIARTIILRKDGTELTFRGQFPPAGVSERADEVYGLMLAGVYNAVSIGFDPRKTRQITVDGERVTEVLEAVLVEISVVSVPALPSALITERSLRRSNRATLQRDTVGHYREIVARMERAMLAEKYERELRAEGQADAPAATRRGGGSTRESRAAMARLYQMDIKYDARERAFEARTTGQGLRR